MWNLSSKSLLLLALCINVFCSLTVTGEHPDNVEDSSRRGRIFDRQFWEGFERGLKDTANMFQRVTDNIEVAIDQVAGGLEDQITSFADRIDERVDQVMPPFMRQRFNDQSLSNSNHFQVNAIGGNIGDGVDDGLEIYYPTNTDDSRQESAENTGVKINRLPNKKTNDNSQTATPPEPVVKNPFQIRLKTNIFDTPFGGLTPFGPNNGLFGIFKRHQWWEGQNVCVDREEVDEQESNSDDKVEAASEVDTAKIAADEGKTVNKSKGRAKPDFPQIFSFGSMEMSSCKDSGEKYSCITRTSRRGIHKTVTVTYRCCHGFVRDGEGCLKVELRSMPDTLEKLTTTSDFLTLLKAADLLKAISDNNVTIFAPTNEAIEEYTGDLEEQNEYQNSIHGERNNILRKKRESHSLTPSLMSHLVDGYLYAGDISDEQIVPTLNPKSSLRFNIYNIYPLTMTVNCARIIRANQHADNGVIHTIDKVLSPVEKSITDVIESDPQFSILKGLLKKSELLEELRQDGQFTMFAPNDAAFKKLPPSTLKTLLEGSSCLDAVLKNHILSNTICSAAIQGKKRTLNLLKEYSVVERTAEDKLFIEEAEIVDRDVVTTNGVIHVVDKALIPNEAKLVGELLKTHNLTKFMELLEMAELMDELNSQNDVTVFAPSNSAIEEISEEDMKELKSNKEKLTELLRYHITTPSIKARNINNNHMAETKSGHPVRINLYSTMPLLSDILSVSGRAPTRITAGCSRVSVLDTRACGAIVHVVEKMLEIPKSNVVEGLESVPEYSLFNQMVKDTGMDKELAGDGPYTILVPSDHALRTLAESELAALMKNNDLKEKLVKKHVLKEHICCAGVNPNTLLFMDRKRALDGSTIHVRRVNSGKIMAGPARITRCGSPTNNGIIHTVNRVLLSDRTFGEYGTEITGNPGVRIFPISRIGALFGL